MSIQNLMKNAKSVDLFSDMPEKTKKEIDLKGKIAAAILNKRYELNMNQTDFAKFLGTSQSKVSKWENGEVNFTVDAFEEICRKLNLNCTFEINSLGSYPSPSASPVSKIWKAFSTSQIDFAHIGESKNKFSYA